MSGNQYNNTTHTTHLTNEKDHWFGIEIGIFKWRGMEFMEEIVLFQRKNLGLIQPLQSFDDRHEHLRLSFPTVIPSHPREHDDDEDAVKRLSYQSQEFCRRQDMRINDDAHT